MPRPSLADAGERVPRGPPDEARGSVSYTDHERRDSQKQEVARERQRHRPFSKPGNTKARCGEHGKQKRKKRYIRVAPHERDLLRKKAKRAGLSVSEYVRSSAVYGDRPVTVIDIKPLARLNWKLTKHGANLNQMVKFLNTYGERACDADEVARVLDRETDALDKVGEALISLRQEAEAHHVIINLDAPEYDEDEER